MKWKQILLVVAISSASAVGSVAVYNKITKKQEIIVGEARDKMPANYAKFFDSNGTAADPIDFTKAAAAAVPAVVHIKKKIPARKITNDLPNRRGGNGIDDFFDQFFGPGFSPSIVAEQRASDRGVMISDDG